MMIKLHLFLALLASFDGTVSASTLFSNFVRENETNDGGPSVKSDQNESNEKVCATSAVCSLVNLETERAIELGSKTVTFDPFESRDGFSIGCSIDEGIVEYSKFFLDGEKFSDQYFSPELYADPTEQTYWMDGDNRGTRVNAVHPFKECGEKKVDIMFSTWESGDDDPCFDLSFAVEPEKCTDDTEDESEEGESNEKVCATSAVCSLVNLETEKAVELGRKTVTFDPSESRKGFAIGCNIDKGIIEYAKFFLDGEKISDQYFSPELYADPTEQTYWMDGDNRGTQVNAVHPFKECGEKKIDIMFSTWESGDDDPCFDLSFTVEAEGCTGGTPPKPAACNLWIDETLFWGYNAPIALGTTVQVKVASGESFTYPTGATGTFLTNPSNVEEFGTDDFQMRFISPGDAAGEWANCVNYLGTSPYPPSKSKVCFLWGSKLYYGKDIDVSVGSTIETETSDGKTFSYKSRGGEYIVLPAEKSKAYNSLSFQLRVVSSNGDAGKWTTCLTYTPIALDVDGSGAVEYISGEFTIDVNGDGINETLEQWFAPTEGILIDTHYVIKNSIVSGLHMFGDQGRTFTDGFDKLSRLDQDKDGILSGSELDGLAIWVDSNSNTLLEEDEMKSLASFGIISLSTSHENFISQAMKSDGSRMVMEDKWFASKSPTAVQ